MRRARRALLLLVCLTWIGLGIAGTASYVHGYARYRGFQPPKDRPGVSPGRLIKVRFHSPSLGQRRSIDVYLPPGYEQGAARGQRYPVLYLLHGSPGGPSLFIDAAEVGVDLDELVMRHAIQPMLIVLPNGQDGSFYSDTEWADTPHGRYESYVLDVVRQVDARFSTARDRRSRGLGGDSEGAYAAVNVALRNLDTFSVAESWSGYFVQRRAGPFARASLATVAANSPALYVPAMAQRLHRLPLHAFVYAGSRERIIPKARAFTAELRSAGGDATFGVYKGSHDWRLWRDQAPRMLRFANHWFRTFPGLVQPTGRHSQRATAIWETRR